MSHPVVLRSQARKEFDEGIGWYEQRQTGLGVEFSNRVQTVFDRIAARPELYATIYRDVRKARVQKFPYAILDRIRSGRIVVLAVFHNKRNPGIWQSRANL